MVKITSKYNTMSEWLFLAVWTFYSIYYTICYASYLSNTYYDIIHTLSTLGTYATLALLAILFLVDIFISQRWTRRQLVLYTLLLIIALIVEIRIQKSDLVLLILLMFTAQTVNFDKFLKYDIKLKISFLFAILLLCAFGVITNRSNIINGSYKMALGFSHPNVFSCFVLVILVEWLCIRFKKIKWFEWIGIVAIVFIVYEVSKSRSSIYSFAIVLVLYFIANYWPKLFQTKVVRIIITAVPAGIAFFSFYSVYLYSRGNTFALMLNRVLTGRISLAYTALSEKGVRLFGQKITFFSVMNSYDGQTNFLIDNAYVRMALSWGVALTCIFVIIYMIKFVQWSREDQIAILLMSLFFIILGFGECYMIEGFYNLTLLCLFCAPCLSKSERKSKANNKVVKVYS